MRIERRIEEMAKDFAKTLVGEFRRAMLASLIGMGTDKPKVKAGKKTVKKVVASRTARRRGWPKCPTCRKNAHPHGKGFCLKHTKTLAG